MEKTFNNEDAKDALKNQLDSLKNIEYSDWDSLQIAIVLKDKNVANIRMMRQDIEAMELMHYTNKGEIVSMMIATLEEDYKNRKEKE